MRQIDRYTQREGRWCEDDVSTEVSQVQVTIRGAVDHWWAGGRLLDTASPLYLVPGARAVATR